MPCRGHFRGVIKIHIFQIMKQAIPEFQVFIKPVGARCNLDCSYCYYLEKESLYPGAKAAMMGDDVLESCILQHMEATGGNVIGFSWHGGEPMLAGIDFFRKAVEIQKKHQPPGSRILNGIQTNGTLLDDEWCDFLSEENFIVGISMDGPPEMHDRFRLSRDHRPTSGRVLKGLKMLREYRIPTEALCVVNSYNVRSPLDVYRFFRELGFPFLTFLPLVERVPGPAPGVSSSSVPAGLFGTFLIAIFDAWAEKDIGRIKIQVFEEAARTAFSQDHTLCIFKETCGGVPVIEFNGDFFSCDHYVEPAHHLGNIRQDHLSGLLAHPQQIAFGRAKKETLPRYCRKCEVLDMCNGECPRNRFIRTPDGEPGLNYLCEGYRAFFRHCRPFVDAVAAQWKKQQ